MVIGERLKLLHERKNMPQGDIEKRTSLLRCYISRVENGHTVPAVDTLEKMAQAQEAPMYRLFTDEAAVDKPNIPSQKNPSRAVNKEPMLTIDSAKTGLRVRGHVVWSGSKERTGFHKLGVEFESAEPQFWADQYSPNGEEAS